MGNVTRHLTVGAARQPFGRTIRSTVRQSDGADAALALATELLTRSAVQPEFAEQALERLRHRAGAVEVTFWLVNDASATCILRVNETPSHAPLAIVTLADRAVVSERLRRRGSLLCRAGEVSGVEELAPPSANSFAVFAVPDAEDALGALVLGWKASEPACDEGAIANLRLAAGALLRSLLPVRASLADAILNSISDRVAVIDRDGVIVAVNAAWADTPLDLVRGFGRGVSYFDLYRKAAAHASSDAQSVIDGIQSVARGGAPHFQATFSALVSGKEEWSLLTATPLHHPSGGAVVAHTPISPEKVGELAQRIGEKLFDGLVDAIPMPIWIQGADGHVLQGNSGWRTISHASNVPPEGNGTWTDIFHPDDRERAALAFREAVHDQRTFAVEVRVRAEHGTYRWAICNGAPYISVDGRLHGFVVCGCDISAQRHAEWALTEIGSRLLTAQEEERSRIARELHDDLGQQTALIATKIETLLRPSKRSAVTIREGIEDAGRNVQDLAVSIHNLSHELHPPKLKLLGLVKTLESLCRNLSLPESPKVAFKADRLPSDLPERISLSICRVAQEALQNAIKHSGATEIDVQLIAAEPHLLLRISDNGRGFDPFSSSAGIGLVNMRERVELSGGRLLIHTGVTGGTTIEAFLPIDQRE